MNKIKQFTASKSERGQSLVELAISLIVILTLLAGAVDFGIALFSFVSIRDAAQEGALFASINPTEFAEIQERVFSASDSPVDLRNDTTVRAIVVYDSNPDPLVLTLVEVDAASASDAQACEGHGSVIRIEVDYDYQISMPILPGLLGISEIPLSATVTDAILRPPCD
jgi:Flp pilus assembly protein TadG